MLYCPLQSVSIFTKRCKDDCIHRFVGKTYWKSTTQDPEPYYQEKIFTGSQGVPIFGLVAIPKNAHSTIIGTYGITGELETEWFLRVLGRKAYAQGYACCGVI